jgi:hypothetical protein
MAGGCMIEKRKVYTASLDRNKPDLPLEAADI